ncbi:MAG: indole-3-glycerol phosphate synthase TrpC [Deltaproteobacteria bacterium]|nr:indole-3-glycerol phosphate synthase TrpC [Deltaproteobacteria bacterium]
MSARPEGILKRILDRKREEVTALRRRYSLRTLEDAALGQGAARGFLKRIEEADPTSPALIAEFKRASPSKGQLATGVEPAERARSYAAGGAQAMSVLTDADFFRGTMEDLERARDATEIPVLRKDFIIDPFQVFETRAAGADAMLLIVAALDRVQLGELLAAAREVGLDTLVEVHHARELDIALERGAELVGINNRDLTTFETSLDVTLRLAPEIPRTIPVVSESGIYTRDDVLRVGEAGVRGVLVGESLMRADDPVAQIRSLLGRGRLT